MEVQFMKENHSDEHPINDHVSVQNDQQYIDYNLSNPSPFLLIDNSPCKLANESEVASPLRTRTRTFSFEQFGNPTQGDLLSSPGRHDLLAGY